MRILVVCNLAMAIAPQVTRPAPFDIVIRNGHVIDGTGSPWYAADLGIRNGRIAAIGRLVNAPARQVIDAREVLPERAPVRGDLQVRVADLVGLDDRVVQRRHGAPFAGDLRRDALENLRRHVRLDQQGQLRLAEHVDEAGGKDAAARVDDLPCRRVRQPADGGDTPVPDPDVRGVPGRSRAVDHVAVADHDVEGRGARLPRRSLGGGGWLAGAERQHERAKDQGSHGRDLIWSGRLSRTISRRGRGGAESATNLDANDYQRPLLVCALRGRSYVTSRCLL